VSHRAFAEYHLVMSRDDLEVLDGPGSVVVLDKARLTVGRGPQSDVMVRFLEPQQFRGWGGRSNHNLRWYPGQGWFIEHLGHHGVIRVGDDEMPPLSRPRLLTHGTRVEPSEDLVFEFRLRPDLEELWEACRRDGVPLDGKQEVLEDALIERAGLDREGAQRALRHFAARRS
jgi:hypothetical protein